jgi:hypothetical protein
MIFSGSDMEISLSLSPILSCSYASSELECGYTDELNVIRIGANLAGVPRRGVWTAGFGGIWMPIFVYSFVTESARGLNISHYLFSSF